MFFNRYQNATIKYCRQMIGDSRTADNLKIIERLCAYLVTEDDAKQFFRLIADLYESGYLKAVNDYKGKMEEIGIQVKVVPSQAKEG